MLPWRVRPLRRPRALSTFLIFCLGSVGVSRDNTVRGNRTAASVTNSPLRRFLSEVPGCPLRDPLRDPSETPKPLRTSSGLLPLFLLPLNLSPRLGSGPGRRDRKHRPHSDGMARQAWMEKSTSRQTGRQIDGKSDPRWMEENAGEKCAKEAEADAIHRFVRHWLDSARD